MPSHELGGRGSEDKLLQAPQEAKYLLIVAFIVWLLLSRNVSHVYNCGLLKKKKNYWLKNTFILHYTTKQQTTNPYWEIIIQWKEILVSMLTLWRLWPWQITARRRRQPANLYLSNKWPSTSTSIPFPWSTSNRRRYFHFYHFAC